MCAQLGSERLHAPAISRTCGIEEEAAEGREVAEEVPGGIQGSSKARAEDEEAGMVRVECICYKGGEEDYFAQWV